MIGGCNQGLFHPWRQTHAVFCRLKEEAAFLCLTSQLWWQTWPRAASPPPRSHSGSPSRQSHPPPPCWSQLLGREDTGPFRWRSEYFIYIIYIKSASEFALSLPLKWIKKKTTIRRNISATWIWQQKSICGSELPVCVSGRSAFLVWLASCRLC